jgi:peptide/nickel transport system ATP-binding protein
VSPTHHAAVGARLPTPVDARRTKEPVTIPLRETNGMPLLQAKNLSISFQSTRGPLTVVSDVSFSIAPRERVALVGESGSGKTLTGMICLGLMASNSKVTGSVVLDGTELVGASEAQLRAVRGKKVGVVFQDPSTSLNPVKTVGDQIAEMYRRHEAMNHAAARLKAIEMMDAVRIPAAEYRYDAYPHQLSGGMKQRIMIAIALTLSPSLLILDEPTTALDVTVEAQIMDLLLEISETREMAVLMISHDLGVVSNMCDRVMTMYAGQIVEQGPTRDVYDRPTHPYTAALLNSIVDLDEPRRRLEPILGQPPSAAALPSGCRFEPRCRYSVTACSQTVPLIKLTDQRSARCIFAERALHSAEPIL